jgi:hypothetical protein
LNPSTNQIQQLSGRKKKITRIHVLPKYQITHIQYDQYPDFYMPNKTKPPTPYFI